MPLGHLGVALGFRVNTDSSSSASLGSKPARLSRLEHAALHPASRGWPPNVQAGFETVPLPRCFATSFTGAAIHDGALQEGGSVIQREPHDTPEAVDDGLASLG